MKAYVEQKVPGAISTNVAISLPDGRTLRCGVYADSIFSEPPITREQEVTDEEKATWIETEISDELVKQLQAIETAYNDAEPALQFLINTSYNQ